MLHPKMQVYALELNGSTHQIQRLKKYIHQWMGPSVFLPNCYAHLDMMPYWTEPCPLKFQQFQDIDYYHRSVLVATNFEPLQN